MGTYSFKKQIVGLLLILSIGLSGLRAAEILGPGWQMTSPVAPLTVVPAGNPATPASPAVPLSASRSVGSALSGDFQALALVAGPSPTALTPELQTLAAGLGNDPLRIFNFVRTKIAYQPYYGSHKGAHTTYLDEAGNDIDQCSLLIALLNQAGFTNCNYVYGKLTIPDTAADGQDLNHWIGQASPSGFLAVYTLLYGGVPVGTGTDYGSFVTWPIDHVWVRAVIGGVSYDLDPSFKKSEIFTPIDFRTVSGYARSQLVTDAAGTSTADYAQNLSRTAVETRLGQYATTLANHIKATLPNAEPEAVYGGHRLDVQGVTHLAQGAPLPAFSPTTTGGAPYGVFSTIPSNYQATLRVQIGTQIDSTFNLDGLQANRLSLVFSGSNAQFWKGDSLVAEETNGSGPSANVTLTLNHSSSRASQTLNSVAYLRNGSYDLTYAVYPNPRSNGQIDASNRRLQSYLAGGLTDTSRQVLTETLRGLGIKWVRRVALSIELTARIRGLGQHLHHIIGRTGQESSYYVDMPGVVASLFDNTGAYAVSAFNTSAFMLSAMEHGVIEQNSDKLALSTVKCLVLANDGAQRIFKATSANYATGFNIEAQLTANTYSNSQKATFASLVGAGHTVLLHQNGQTGYPGLNQWKGLGYADISNSTVGMIIGGLFSGGYAATPGNASGTNTTAQTNTIPPTVNTVSTNTTRPMSLEPVDLLTGYYTMDATDLTVGLANSPRGLSFSRSYDSGRNFISTTLGNGWRHSNEGRVTLSSDLDSAFALRQPIDAAQTIIGVLAAADFADTTLPPRELMIGMFAANWTTNRITNNSANVQLGAQAFTYTNLSDGTWNPPPGSTTALTGASGTFTLVPRFGGSVNFDSQNRVSTWKDVDDNTQTYSYDPTTGKLTTVTDAFGRTLTFAYGTSGPANGLLTSVTDNTSPSRSVQFTYTAGTSGSANLTSITDPELYNTTLLYDSRNRLTDWKDHANTTVAHNDYDAFDRVYQQLSQGSALKTWHFLYAPGETRETNPAGGTTAHLFDHKSRAIATIDAVEMGKVSALTDLTARSAALAAQKATRRAYDGQNHVVSTTDATGRTTTVGYDGFQNLTSTTDPAGKTTTYTYDAALRLWKVTDPTGRYTEFTYDAEHHLTDTWDPGRRRTRYTYRTDGLPASIIDPDSQTTTYTAYDKGLPTAITRADATTTSATYSPRGQLLTSTNARGHTITFAYDQRGLLTSTKDARNLTTGSTTTYTYDSHGTLAGVTDRNGQVTTTVFDNFGRLLSTDAPDTAPVTRAYDNRDWLASITDGLGHATTYGYDAAGRVTSLTNARSVVAAQTTFDAAGRPLVQKNGLLHATTTAYDPAGRVDYVSDPLDHITEFSYDDAGRRLTLTNKRARTYSFGYATDGLPTTFTHPSGRVSQVITREARGLPTLTRSPGGDDTAATYDALGRLKTRTDPVGTQTLTYDNEGNLLTLVEDPVAAGAPDTTITRVYDSLGRVTSYTDAAGYSIAYLYDHEGNLTRITYPGTPTRSVDYTYDGAKRLKTVTDWAGRVTTHTYDTVGRLTTVDRPNTTRQRQLYDDTHRLTAAHEEKMSGVNITGTLWQADYGYDNADRLASYTPTPAAKLYAPPATTLSYNNDNQIATYNGQSITHDLDGNMLAVPVGTGPRGMPGTLLGAAVWDARNRLLSAGGVSYTYDAENRRLTSTVTATGAVTRYLYHKGGALDKLLAKINPDGSVTRYVYGAGLLYEETSSSVGVAQAPVYYHFNWRGDTIAMSDSTGAVVARLAYSPYGERTVESGAAIADASPFGFNGRWGVMTEPTGLVCMQARFYSPTLRRFLSEDPAGFSGGVNLYAFAAGNPIDLMDPFGLGPVNSASIWSGVASAALAGGDQFAYMLLTPVRMVGEALNTARQITTALAHETGFMDPTMAGGVFDAATIAVPALLSRPAAVVAQVETTALTGTEAARAALGKGPFANPGAPLTAEMRAALQQNLAAAEKNLGLANQGLNHVGNTFGSARTQQVAVSAAQNRVNEIKAIIESGVQAPKN